jgi:hypothetical protein
MQTREKSDEEKVQSLPSFQTKIAKLGSHTGSSPVDRNGARQFRALRRRDWLLCASSQICHNNSLTTGPVAGPAKMRHTVY